jgi:hypothetical protein
MGVWQVGQYRSEAVVSQRAPGLPQAGQYWASRNIILKQAGQAIVARRAPQ